MASRACLISAVFSLNVRSSLSAVSPRGSKAPPAQQRCLISLHARCAGCLAMFSSNVQPSQSAISPRGSKAPPAQH